MFKEVWNLALTKDNILSAWAKTGIMPYTPHIVVNTLKPILLAPPENIIPRR
jgi:hypothetical protein